MGSGLGDFVKNLQNQRTISYDEIEYFAECSIEGHHGNLVCGDFQGQRVVVMQGRLHFYEGHSISDVVFPVRTLCKLGIENLVLTNASGGLNPKHPPGSFMLIKDHINLMGQNPLIGPNDENLGSRFPDMSCVYDPKAIEQVMAAAKKEKISVFSGVYAAVTGPCYETPSEVKYLHAIGADAVGMSTVPEVIAARHMGVNTFGISCITNLGSGLTDNKLDHHEVKEVAQRVKREFVRLLEIVLTIDVLEKVK